MDPDITRPPTSSPHQLPPRSQLIQLKPTMVKTKTPNKTNKQSCPKFVPYEPYSCAIRPIAMDTDQIPSIVPAKDHHETETRLKQIVEKQNHSLTLLKERLKIADKDNNDLHKENIRLKKLLVDSLSGDISQSRTDVNHDSIRNAATTNESVDALCNEIEVWRSKFLSSCVLVEQLTRENGTLTETVGSATNIFRDLKMSDDLTPNNYELINMWLRSNRAPASPTPNKLNGMVSS